MALLLVVGLLLLAREILHAFPVVGFVLCLVLVLAFWVGAAALITLLLTYLYPLDYLRAFRWTLGVLLVALLVGVYESRILPHSLLRKRQD